MEVHKKMDFFDIFDVLDICDLGVPNFWWIFKTFFLQNFITVVIINQYLDQKLPHGHHGLFHISIKLSK